MQARLDREGIGALLGSQRDFRLLGSAASGQEVVEICARLRPQVLILSVLVPWPPDVPSLSAVRMCSPGTRVLVMAPHSVDRCARLHRHDGPDPCCRLPHPHADCLAAALAHGASGAVHRDAAPEDLFRAVRSVASGERWIEAGIDVSTPRPITISSRERRVALMIGEGSSNKEIASRLQISEETVKKHVGHVLRKLGLSDRLQLGLCVARHATLFDDE